MIWPAWLEVSHRSQQSSCGLGLRVSQALLGLEELLPSPVEWLPAGLSSSLDGRQRTLLLAVGLSIDSLNTLTVWLSRASVPGTHTQDSSLSFYVAVVQLLTCV